MTARHVGAARVVADLRRETLLRGTSKRFAHESGIGVGSVSQVRRGYRPPSEAIANTLGYRKLIVWVREEELALADRIEAELNTAEMLKEGE